MKLNCLNCGHEFEGTISHDELGWHSSCPVCDCSFDVDVPDGRIVMAFADPVDDADDDENRYKYFTDDFTGEGIHAYYAFDTAEEFIEKWLEIYDKPNGMWYWVLDNGDCICSGACDPSDIEIFVENWNIFVAIEMCPHCGNESVYPMWDVNVKGYVAICEHCGKEIMLCDECIHAEDELNAHCMGCDWRKTECGGKCFRGETREN